MSPNKKTAAAALGEHDIIQLMRRHFTPMPNNSVPFGDDVSAMPIQPTNGDVAVLKTDMLVAKTDVPAGMTLWQAARKAVIMNVSDFAAKGAVPTAVLAALGLPRGLPRGDLEEIAKGLDSGARQYGAYVVGGDTGEASDLVISVSLFGTGKKEKLVFRSGAKAGDILAVTGFFGRSAAGLRLLQDKTCKIPEASRAGLVDAVLMPMARLREGLALAGCGVSASIDSSDGLAWCLHELASQSGVGFVVSALPVAAEVVEFAKLNGLDAVELALYGGEEYELVVTVPRERWEAAVSVVEAVGGKLLHIGKATREKQVLLETEGKKTEIQARGYEHFKT